jgi:hypothetical protein
LYHTIITVEALGFGFELVWLLFIDKGMAVFFEMGAITLACASK